MVRMVYLVHKQILYFKSILYFVYFMHFKQTMQFMSFSFVFKLLQSWCKQKTNYVSLKVYIGKYKYAVFIRQHSAIMLWLLFVMV